MNFHPYSEIFPMIEGADFDALVDDIKENGLREKIWMYEGKILDGRNRFLACKKARVRPATRKFTGKNAQAFVISANIHRRHLTESQRALVAAKLASLPHGGDRRSDQAANLPLETQASAAEKLKVSARSVRSAKQVLDKGSKALRDAVEAGDVPISKAASVVDLPKAEQLAAATKKSELLKPVEVTTAPDFDFADYEPEDDDAYKANVENVMMADDKLAAMRAELKQIHREMQGLKASRDHYQSEAGAAVRLVKARDREIDKLKKQLAKAEEENESLRERVSIMEVAA
jgi:hypothetical protein